MGSNKTRRQILKDAFDCLTTGSVPDDILDNYINDEDGSAFIPLQEWCANNMKGWCEDWNTGIGIIEAAELMYSVALQNGNING